MPLGRRSLALLLVATLIAPASLYGEDAPAASPLATSPPASQDKSDAAATQNAPPRSVGGLPWAQSDASPKSATSRKPSSARELLVNVDDSQMNALIDGRPLGLDEEETLVRILFRVPKIGQFNIEELTRDPIAWKTLFDEPAPHRLEIYRLQGRVERVQKFNLLPEQAERFDFDHYFRVTMRLDDSPYRATIFTQVVPDAWKKKSDLDERASALGLFLKVGVPDGERADLAFAAQRVAWHPDQPRSEWGVLPDHVVLGDLGMDYGLFDNVRGVDDHRTRNGKDIGVEETECFYQLLAAARRTSQQELAELAPPPIDLPVALQDPRSLHGTLATIRGRARRITRIAVENPEFQKRFGFDHYYEIYVYVPLGNAEVRLAGKKTDKNAPVVSGAFPVACCVTQLPAKWSHLAKGSDDLHENVRITGFNFKLWAFQTQMLQRYAAEEFERSAQSGVASSAPKRRPLQPCPLFIGPEVEFLPADKGDSGAAGTAITLLVVAILAALGSTLYVVWQQRSSSRGGLASNPGGANADDKPDFSGLG